jgi:phosphopantothenoylcysteine decarboxylase/phosphopantothenate--cysteine ligase
MTEWDHKPPTPSDLGDHEVPREGDALHEVRIALLVTGGIAAYTTPTLARSLRRQGAYVQAFCSGEALRYVTAETLEWATTNPCITRLTPDAEHLSDHAPFDVYLVAPASYNTIGKVVSGIADTVVTASLAAALGRMEQGRSAVLFAPTMHGTMHNQVLIGNCRRLAELGVRVIPPRDAYGKHNLPREEVLVAEVTEAVIRLRAGRPVR